MKPLIVLTGPTAVGKTNLSISLAKAVGGSIISADSIQVYKYMDIGSAKIMPEEMKGIPHYLVDLLDPREEFDVSRFKDLAQEAMEEIYGAGRIPIIVGGTGFYIQAILRDVDFTAETGDRDYRNSLYKLAEDNGPEVLWQKLKEVDPLSAEKIHANNVKRVARALEFYKENGFPISRHNAEEKAKESPYNYAYFVLNDHRNVLYERIEKRVDLMIQQGLEEEVRRLLDMGYDSNLVSMQGLGYKEMVSYIKGECSLEEAIYIIKRDTRHFAKRQLTWFRHQDDVILIDKGEYNHSEEAMLQYMLKLLKEKNIIE